MESQEKKPISYYLRALHRDIGFFVVGLVLVYSLSGIVLVYRDTDLLLREVQVERKLEPGIDPSDLGKALRVRGLTVEKTDGDVVQFAGGTYNKATGVAKYITKEQPAFVQSLVGLHKTVSGKVTHWYAVLFGVLLCFLAVSSFWMYPNNTSKLRRGVYIALAGVVVTTIVLFL